MATADAERHRLAQADAGERAVARLGPVPGRAGLGHGPRGLQRARHGLGLLPARPRPLPRLPVERGRHGRHLRRPADVLLRASRCGTARTRSSRSGCSASAATAATTARTSRSTGGTRTPRPPTPGCAGATTTRRPRSRTTTWSRSTRQRGRDEPEYELVDTGIFDDDRYWAVTVDYAKASPTDMCIVVTVANRGDRGGDRCTCCPTLWFRNTWSWGLPGRDQVPAHHRPTATGWSAEHRVLGAAGAGGRRRARPRCSATTRPTPQRLWGLPGRSPLPEGRHQRPRGRTAPTRSTRTGDGHQGRAALRARRAGRASTRRSGCG